MNRRHTKQEAFQCIELAHQAGFEHISMDLIYGIPGLSDVEWLEQLNTVAELPINHLSCYALTVEQGTPLAKSIRLKKAEDVDDHAAALHFAMLQHWAGESGWEHYEVSNLCKPENRALHNSAYWSGAQYLGLGPAAHSFQGLTRRINIANNTQYIHSLLKGKEVAHTMEKLSLRDRFNELILTGIRTANGIDVSAVRNISRKHAELLLQKIQNEADKYDYDTNESSIKLKSDYWFQSDGIAADLMILEKEWLN
jgi:oxygen-independent coproporphyrinogen-3 oxidase